MAISIHDLRQTVQLLKKVNCQGYALISETAREMGIKKTELMLFIEQNPKLFQLTEAKNARTGKTTGLAIRQVFLSPEENPDTPEWLGKMKKLWDHRLHVGGCYYYNSLEFLHFPEELPDSRESLFRNTPEKFKELEEAGLLKKQKRTYGGLSDSYTTEVYLWTPETEKLLQEKGWSTDSESIRKDHA